MKDKVIRAINEKFREVKSCLMVRDEDGDIKIVIKDPLIKSDSVLNLTDEVWDLIDEAISKDLGIKEKVTFNNTGRIFWCYDEHGNKLF